ncbi:MAG: hypothetical protein VX938_03960 [Myxococcota bacterium]|nr:hypothetical protein [Myxococcota bacterium]
MKKTLVSLLACAVMALMSSPAFATTVLKVDVPNMTQTSEWVVQARVGSVTPADLRSEGRGFFTDVELLISNVYKGVNVPSRYVMRLVGGEGKDGMRLWIPGMPTFKKGEEVVLFMERTSLGHIPCGLGQGVWRIHKGPSGDSWVRQSVGGMHLMERGPTGHLQGAHLPMVTPMKSLGDLAYEIYAAQPPAKP